jgi:uncharacterized repeat protein (TIGR01451 family)
MNLRPARLFPFVALAAVLLSSAATAQMPVPPPPPPSRGPCPLLFVRFSGPEGMIATFYQGRAPARSFPAPVVVGMRPGYAHRVRLGDFPGRPGISIYPTLTIVGNLLLSPKLNAASFPATVALTEADIEAIAIGTMVTKVIYLEHPDRAEPTATRPGEILETNRPIGTDIVQEARDNGRVMIVVHFGGRLPTAEEIVQQNVPGTILFPGERSMSHPAGPPLFPVIPWKYYDPYYGPRLPEEECLHDGGDRGRKAAFDSQGNLAGVDPEDTVAEYRDASGRRSIACSNRVCLCVPRYVVLRKELPLALNENTIALSDTRLVQKQIEYQETLPPNLTIQYAKLKADLGRLRPSINLAEQGPNVLIGLKVLQAHHIDLALAEYVGTQEVKLLTLVQRAQLLKQLELVRVFSSITPIAGIEQIVGTRVVGRVEAGPDVVSAVLSTRDLTVCCGEPIPPDRPLCLFKCADRGSAQVGDIVTFSLRYSNVGGRVITDVAVADSLSGRLEYVEGSAESDRDAVFTTQPNEAGSVILRWEISGRLLPGQSGRLRFKARVR